MDVPPEILARLSEIKREVNQFESFCFISNIATAELIKYANPDKMRIGSVNFLVPELAALICLQETYQSDLLVHAEDYIDKIKYIHELIFELCKEVNSYKNEHITKDWDDNKDIDRLIVAFLLQEFHLRNPVAKILHEKLMREMYLPYSDILVEEFGFDIKDAIKISSSIGYLKDSIMDEEKEIADAISKKWYSEYKEYKYKNILPHTQYIIERLGSIAAIPESEIKKIFKFDSFLYHCIINPDAHTFTVEELADYCEVGMHKVTSYLKYFSCEFGQGSINDIFSPNHKLKKTPIIHNEGRYFCPSIPLLSWSIEPFFENHLKSIKKFTTIRHDLLVKLAIEAIQGILPNATCYSHLSYNDSKNELDVLILFDGYAIIIECKGNRISDVAKHGRKERILTHISEIIKKSHEQSRSAVNYLKSNSAAVFLPKKGKKITVDTSKIENYVCISLTLETLSMVPIIIKHDNSLGIEPEAFPWVLNIYDLMAICEHIPFPSVFFHYYMRRQEFSMDNRVSTHDELDLFSWYMENDLYLKELGDMMGFGTVFFGDSSDQLNKYYIRKAGFGKGYVPKLKKKIPDEFLKLLVAINKSEIDQRTEIASLLLNLREKQMLKLLEYIKMTKRKNKFDKDIHDFSLYTEFSNIGITYIVGQNKAELETMLHMLCSGKLEKNGASYWIGLADSSNKDFKITKLMLSKDRLGN